MFLKHKLREALFGEKNLERNLQDLVVCMDKEATLSAGLKFKKGEEDKTTNAELVELFERSKQIFGASLGYKFEKVPKIVYSPPIKFIGPLSYARIYAHATWPTNVVVPATVGLATGLAAGPFVGGIAVVYALATMVVGAGVVTSGKITDKNVLTRKRIVVTSPTGINAKLEMFHDITHFVRKDMGKFQYGNRFLEDGLANYMANRIVAHTTDTKTKTAASLMNKVALSSTYKFLYRKHAKVSFEFKDSVRRSVMSDSITGGSSTDYGGLSMMLLAEHRQGSGFLKEIFKGNYEPLLK